MNKKPLPPLSTEKTNLGPAAKSQFYKRIGLWVYGVVIVLILAAMIQLIRNEPDNYDHETVLISDEDVQTVLAASSGSVTVPISNLEAILPVKAPVPAWRMHAASWHESDKKKIAIVIDDMGLDINMSHHFAMIQAPLTMSFLPYAKGLPNQAAMMRRGGHELMVHLPMEPKNNAADPGPNALLSTVAYPEFERRIQWNLSQFENFVGINNHMGSALTEDPVLMVRVMAHLRKEGMLFLDSLTSPDSVGARAAIATGVPYIERDIFLDNERSLPSILAQLAKTEKIARKRGYAIAIGHPYIETLDALEFWTAQLDKDTFALVPISQLVALKSQKQKVAANDTKTE